MYRPISLKRTVYGDGASCLICGSAMKLPAEIRKLAGQVQCVYLDPPFMTGKNFRRKRCYGEKGWRKGSPVLTLPGFEDSFESERDFLRLLRRLIQAGADLLNPSGVFCLHLDWRMSARARILCDRVFGPEQFLNEIIWSYESGGRSRKYFPRKHDTILMYGKSGNTRFDLTRLPLPRGENRKNHMARGIDENGRTYSSINSHGKEYRYYDDEPVYPGDVWTDIGFLQQRDPERTGYATQKPLKLLDRLLRPVVQEGDWVVDLCCGSGTALAAAQALGCRFAGLDLSPAAISVSLARLAPENLTVVCPCAETGAEFLTEYRPETRRLQILGLRVPQDEALAGLSPDNVLESWEPGRIERGVFYPEKTYRRSFRYPALVDSLQLAPEDIPRAVMATDAAGGRHAFEWVADE